MSARFLSVAVAVALAAAPAFAADPPKPAIVAQAQPVSKLLGDFKLAAKFAAGDDIVKVIDAGIKDALGEKGFTGIDLTRHILGYAFLNEKLEKTGGVFLIPVTDEADFKDFLARLTATGPKIKLDPVEGSKGLFVVVGGPEPKPAPIPFHARFADGYAYFGVNIPPEEFTAASLVKPNDLLNRADTSVMSYRLNIDRVPAGLKKQVFDELDKTVAKMAADDNAPDAAKKAAKLYTGFVKRLGEQVLKDGDATGVRLVFDPNTAEIAYEQWLTAKKGTPLAKEIAARKPGTNQFAGLVTKDAAVGLMFQLPLFADELRELAVLGIEQAEKAIPLPADSPELVKDLFAEPFKGLIRTVKTGQFDVGAAVLGPDADGHFNVAAGVSYEDTANLEKLLRDFVRILPEKNRKHVKLDVAKVGKVAIHEIKPDIFPPRPDGKDLPPGSVFVAFAPTAIYATFGPTGLQAMQDLLAGKPAAARAFDLTINPKRLQKLLASFSKDAGDAFATFVGTDDASLSVFHVELLGGDELKLRYGASLKAFPRLIPMLGQNANKTFNQVPQKLPAK